MGGGKLESKESKETGRGTSSGLGRGGHKRPVHKYRALRHNQAENGVGQARQGRERPSTPNLGDKVLGNRGDCYNVPLCDLLPHGAPQHGSGDRPPPSV